MPVSVGFEPPAANVTSRYGRDVIVSTPTVAPLSGLASFATGGSPGTTKNSAAPASFVVPCESANVPGRKKTPTVLYGSSASFGAENAGFVVSFAVKK